MLAINACQRYPESDLQKSRDYLVLHHPYQDAAEIYYGAAMVKIAGAQRLSHLERVMVNMDHLKVNDVRSAIR